MDLSKRRSNPQFPTNGLAARALMRDLAKEIGINGNIEQLTSAKFKDTYIKYLKKNNKSYKTKNLEVSKSTFKRWMKGQSFPNSKAQRTFFNYCHEIRDKYVMRSNFNCRFQRYLATLDLMWMKLEKDQIDESNALAEQVLKEIHQDWRFDDSMDIALKGPFEKDPFGNPHLRFKREFYCRDGLYPEDTVFSTELKHRSYIYPRIDFQKVTMHQPDSKLSVVPHLLWLAFHLKPTGPKIHFALILDLLSALNSADHLNYYRIERFLFSVPTQKTLSEYFGSLTYKIFISDYHLQRDNLNGSSIFGESKEHNSLEWEFNEISKPNIERNSEFKLPEKCVDNLWFIKKMFYEKVSLMTGLTPEKLLDEISRTRSYVNKIPYKVKFGGVEFLDQ